jgi:glycosyltransferase involved in cell wall biosynthesis
MKIVMIDRNSVIDRRIILEAETLIREGFEVELILQEAIGPAPWVESLSFPVKRFSVFPDLDADLSAIDDINLVQDFRHCWEKYLGTKPALLIGALLNPSAGKKFAVTANSLSRWQMFSLLSVLGLLDAKPESFLKRLTFSFKMAQKGILAVFAKSHVFDSWEERVFENLRLRDFDVVHIHDLPVLPLGQRVKNELGKKLVYDAHELYAHLPGLSSKAKKRLFGLEKTFLPSADHVVLINEQQAQIMVAEYGQFPYVCLTNATRPPLGFDPRQKPDLIREKLGIAKDEPIILFQGVINRVRKIDVLLEGVALARAKPHMVFLTWGKEEIADFTGIANGLGIKDRVHFLPPVPWEDVIVWAASADAGMMPYQPDDLNTQISSPNKMYEFMEAGIPMIGSSGLVNVKAVVGDLGLGVVSALKDPADYAAAIDLLFLGDPSFYNRSKDRVLENRHRFTWDELSKPFVHMYSLMRTEGNFS